MSQLAQVGGQAHQGEVIFIPRSYAIFYLTSKSLLCRWKRIVLINVAPRRLQQLYFTI